VNGTGLIGIDICADIAVRIENETAQNNSDSFTELSSWANVRRFADVFICPSI
jgi:hypothetical protein